MPPLAKTARANLLLMGAEARAMATYDRAITEVLHWPPHLPCFGAPLEVGIYKVVVGYNRDPEYVATHGGSYTYHYHDHTVGLVGGITDRTLALAFIEEHIGDHASIDMPGLAVVGGRR